MQHWWSVVVRPEVGVTSPLVALLQQCVPVNVGEERMQFYAISSFDAATESLTRVALEKLQRNITCFR